MASNINSPPPIHPPRMVVLNVFIVQFSIVLDRCTLLATCQHHYGTNSVPPWHTLPTLLPCPLSKAKHLTSSGSTGSLPSLSHLWEIGCHAFALIQTHNPKNFQRSKPCTLIRYAPHSKAYRLWDNTTGNIFNSFYVTFVEHLNSLPSNLLPETTLLFDPDAPSSWEVPSPDQATLPAQQPTSNMPLTITSSPPLSPIDNEPGDTFIPPLNLPCHWHSTYGSSS